MKKLTLLAGVFFTIVACAPKTTEGVTEEVNEKAEMPEFALAGRTMMEDNCVKCHKLKEVDRYTSEQWSKILPKMAKKAKLEPAQTASIQEYITWELAN